MLNQIQNINCLDLINSIKEESVAGIVTDFPYGIDFQSNMRKKTAKFNKIANDKKPYIEWILPSWYIIKDPGFLFTFYRFDVQDVLFEAIERAGFKIKSQCIWYKNTTSMGDLDGSFAVEHELMVFAVKGNYKFPTDKRPSGFYKCTRDFSQHMVHPNQKPIDLMRKIVFDLTKKGDIIVEPFAGSGATCIGARLEGRNFYASELLEEHIIKANERIKQYEHQFI